MYFITQPFFYLLFVGEVFQELSTFPHIDALHIFGIQFSFKLCDTFKPFLFHPCGQETSHFSNIHVGILVDRASYFYS